MNIKEEEQTVNANNRVLKYP